ncbi:GNAT family N-acetyltransferase [Micromonospora sp. GCM10011542]|uniref:GNAT family N-acetyltransferase n=1 Tax=Micromonospora sp. GCM10011542 TaxID=3317337 RepID=UPI003622C344
MASVSRSPVLTPGNEPRAAAVDLPVTADLERGYGDVAETVRAAICTGAVGGNLDDAMRRNTCPMTIDVRTPDRPASASDAPLRQARNSAAFWAATGHARGHRVIRRRGFVAVVGDERAGLRVLIQKPDLWREEVAEISDLATRAAGPVDAEDPFSSTDLSHLRMRNWQMPIMLRQPGAVAEPAMNVLRAPSESDLRAAERAVIAAFALARFEPYQGGEMFPIALIHQPGVDVFIASLDGEIAGVCVTVVDGGFGSHYWVGTSPAFRSRGVGRAVMLGSLAPMAGLPVTLTASRLGRPLYESLGFAATTASTWWSSR